MKAKLIAKNRRATFDYEPVKQFVAGLVLAGHEAKSARQGNVSLKGAFVTIKDDEAWLTNAHINAYDHASNIDGYDPTHSRKLLVTKRELAELIAARQNGLSIVPLSMEIRGKYIKLVIATARGKKLRDKRQTIAKRELERDLNRDVKYQK